MNLPPLTGTLVSFAIKPLAYSPSGDSTDVCDVEIHYRYCLNKHRISQMKAKSMSCSILRIDTGFSTWLSILGCVLTVFSLCVDSHSIGTSISPLTTKISAFRSLTANRKVSESIPDKMLRPYLLQGLEEKFFLGSDY